MRLLGDTLAQCILWGRQLLLVDRLLDLRPSRGLACACGPISRCARSEGQPAILRVVPHLRLAELREFTRRSHISATICVLGSLRRAHGSRRERDRVRGQPWKVVPRDEHSS
eukprot:CAMPEP_0185550300 /NCGR_PEP_ID=MMETSP1381-20130426/19904_1 /TAXON_ID=298111 /ORGANISM="Pavlova sp., Strain CCMP459" /LENGTH=111 /DNA_ID=CAMNT_0028163075 /DNA_START=995 /DNA_END=1327 /DNA_ORIENTATION=-